MNIDELIEQYFRQPKSEELYNQFSEGIYKEIKGLSDQGENNNGL